MRATLLLLLTAALLIGGCAAAPTLPADVQSTADVDADFDQLQRFAVVHGRTGDARSRRLARLTAEALANWAARRGRTPAATQQPLQVSRDSNEQVHALGETVRRAFTRAGLEHDRRDPDLAVAVEFAHGPYALRPTRTMSPTDPPEVIYGHGVLLHIYDVRRRDQPIWTGAAVAVNSVASFDRIAPGLIDELTRLYPDTIEPTRRSVPVRDGPIVD